MITLAQLRILAAEVFPNTFADFPAMLSAWAIEDPDEELSAILATVDFTPEKMAQALKPFVGSLHREDRELMLSGINKVSEGPVLGIHLLQTLCDNPGSRISRVLIAEGMNLEKLRMHLKRQQPDDGGLLASQGIVTDADANSILRYGRDLTALAAEGEFEDLCDRPEEIERVLDVLLRKKKGNAVLTGPAGVGKTALVELFARRIVKEEVPQVLIGTKIYEVNISKVVAGTRYRGDFEQRMHDVIHAFQEKQPAILFIDEMHLIWGAGRAEGVITDAANILKPFLARGDIRAIGATTVEEYQKYIARDTALARRFEEIRLEEANEQLIFRMVSKQAEGLASHHRIEISEAMIRRAIELTNRHVPNRWQPDKSVDLLDSTAVYAVRNNKANLCEDDLLHVLARQTARPISTLTGNDRTLLLNLENDMKNYIIGQDHVVKKVAAILVCRRQDLGDAQRNLGTFFFAGETGVGKTEMSRVIARVFFSNEKALLHLDLAEYNQPGSVNKLIGSPAGYVDSDREGVLIEWLQHHGSGVILFDDVEKAHPEVHNLMLGLLDTGRIRSSRGVTMDTRQCVIVLTTNAIGSRDLDRGGMGFGKRSEVLDPMELLKDHFPREFLGRLDEILLFNRLGEPEIEAIVKLRLDEAVRRLYQKNIRLIFDEHRLIADLVKSIEESKTGTRGIIRLIESRLMQPISLAILQSDRAGPFTFELGENFYRERKVDVVQGDSIA